MQLLKSIVIFKKELSSDSMVELINTHSESIGFHFEMGQLESLQTDSTIKIEHSDDDIPYYKKKF